MLPRIGLLTLFLCLFSGFTRPQLSNDSKAIYTFETVNTGDGMRVQSSDFFSLTIGFNRSFPLSRVHREQAQELINKLAARFEKLDLPQAEITVGKIYASTREIILNVRLAPHDQNDALKTRLVDFLSKSPDIAFVGEPKSLRID